MQGPHHFAIHSDVARAHPDKRFWLSTREQNSLEDWLNAGGQIPSNLTIRVSQHRQHVPIHGIEEDKQTKKISKLMAMHPNIVGSSVNASHLYDGDVWVCPAANKEGDEGTCEYHGCVGVGVDVIGVVGGGWWLVGGGYPWLVIGGRWSLVGGARARAYPCPWWRRRCNWIIVQTG